MSSDKVADLLLVEKVRLNALNILEQRVEKDLMNHFRYKILPDIKKQIASNLLAEIYEDDKSFTINITFGGE